MNEAALLLIRDCKVTLANQIKEAAKSNDLLAAFCGWLGLFADDEIPINRQAIAEAETAKAGERSSRSVAL